MRVALVAMRLWKFMVWSREGTWAGAAQFGARDRTGKFCAARNKNRSPRLGRRLSGSGRRGLCIDGDFCEAERKIYKRGRGGTAAKTPPVPLAGRTALRLRKAGAQTDSCVLKVPAVNRPVLFLRGGRRICRKNSA